MYWSIFEYTEDGICKSAIGIRISTFLTATSHAVIGAFILLQALSPRFQCLIDRISALQCKSYRHLIVSTITVKQFPYSRLINMIIVRPRTVDRRARMCPAPKKEIKRPIARFGSEGCNAGNPADLKSLLAQCIEYESSNRHSQTHDLGLFE